MNHELSVKNKTVIQMNAASSAYGRWLFEYVDYNSQSKLFTKIKMNSCVKHQRKQGAETKRQTAKLLQTKYVKHVPFQTYVQ